MDLVLVAQTQRKCQVDSASVAGLFDGCQSRPKGQVVKIAGTLMPIVAMSRLSLPIGATVLLMALPASNVSLAQKFLIEKGRPESIPLDVKNKLDDDLTKFQADIQTSSRQITASSPIGKKVEVTSDFASVLSGAKPSASKEFEARKGDKFLVLDKVNDLYAVAANNGKTGWIAAGDVKPDYLKIGAVEEHPTQEDDDVSIKLFQTLTEDAVRFRDSYKDNKYLYVSGFTVHTGVPPAVDLTFSFR
jgi:hypothetical protein